MNQRTAIDLTLCILLFSFLGARLLHCFYEEPAYDSANPLLILQAERRVRILGGSRRRMARWRFVLQFEVGAVLVLGRHRGRSDRVWLWHWSARLFF